MTDKIQSLGFRVQADLDEESIDVEIDGSRAKSGMVFRRDGECFTVSISMFKRIAAKVELFEKMQKDEENA